MSFWNERLLTRDLFNSILLRKGFRIVDFGASVSNVNLAVRPSPRKLQKLEFWSWSKDHFSIEPDSEEAVKITVEEENVQTLASSRFSNGKVVKENRHSVTLA